MLNEESQMPDDSFSLVTLRINAGIVHEAGEESRVSAGITSVAAASADVGL